MPSMNGAITLRERVKRQDTLSAIANNDFQYYLAKLSSSLALHSESPWFYIVLLIQDSVTAEKNMHTLFSPTLSKYHTVSIRTDKTRSNIQSILRKTIEGYKILLII